MLESLERVLGEREEQLLELNTYNEKLSTEYNEKVVLGVELIPKLPSISSSMYIGLVRPGL